MSTNEKHPRPWRLEMPPKRKRSDSRECRLPVVKDANGKVVWLWSSSYAMQLAVDAVNKVAAEEGLV